MATIPTGLRADYMRKRMEDKYTIQNTGGLYIGSSDTVTYVNNKTGSETISAYGTTELPPGAEFTVLQVTDSATTPVNYNLITTDNIADNGIDSTLLTKGVIQKNSVVIKKYLSFSGNSQTNTLTINFTDTIS